MKNFLLNLAFFSLISSSAYSETCRIADTIINDLPNYYMSNDAVKMNFTRMELYEKKFTTTKLDELKPGDYVFALVKSYGENGREQFGLSHCLLTGYLSLATLGEEKVECMIPDDVMEITTVNLRRVEIAPDGNLDFQVIDEFQVKTEWAGPNLPNLHQKLSRRSKNMLLPCSYY